MGESLNDSSATNMLLPSLWGSSAQKSYSGKWNGEWLLIVRLAESDLMMTTADSGSYLARHGRKAERKRRHTRHILRERASRMGIQNLNHPPHAKRIK